MDPAHVLKDNLQKCRTFVLLKIQSFRVIQMAQSKPQIPTRTRDFSLGCTPSDQFPNIFVLLVDGGKLQAIIHMSKIAWQVDSE